MYVDSGAARLAYTVRGDGPALFLLHAGVADRRSWGPLVEHLGNGYRTIAYDRRGFGETTYRSEPHVEMHDALAVLDAAGVTSAVVIGASNGGRRAVDLALAHPERVRALVLIGAGVSGAPDADPTAFSVEVRERFAAYASAEGGGDLDEVNRVEAHVWLDGWSADEGRVSGAPRDLFLDMNGIALRAGDPGPETPSEPAWDRLGSIRVPTLVLRGEFDVVMASTSEHLAAEIPGARYAELASVGHLPHLEGDPRTLELIAEFVADMT